MAYGHNSVHSSSQTCLILPSHTIIFRTTMKVAFVSVIFAVAATEVISAQGISVKHKDGNRIGARALEDFSLSFASGIKEEHSADADEQGNSMGKAGKAGKGCKEPAGCADAYLLFTEGGECLIDDRINDDDCSYFLYGVLVAAECSWAIELSNRPGAQATGVQWGW